MLLKPASPHPFSKIATRLRLDILNTVFQSGFGHLGGSFSSLDILTALYFSDLFDFNHDHFVLSAGHLCLAHYAVLSKIGKFPHDLLKTYATIDSALQGHESTEVPGVEYSSGSLGQGLSFASGLALGDRSRHTVCLTTDGEHNQGQIWEALLFANKYHQGNLINIIDHNHCQIDGTTDDIMPLGELAAKYIRFGWTVITVNGHNYHQLLKAFKQARQSTIYPACIIANTVLAKGISFMENNCQYHDIKNLDQKDYYRAKAELEAKL